MNRTDTDTHGMLDRIMLASGALETLLAELRQQVQESQAAIGTTREQEEAKFKQAMTALFHDQQQRTQTALQPWIARAWQVFAGLVVVCVLAFAAALLLLSRANDQLKAAQARAEAAQVQAEVQEALRHVEITSCAGRPCIKLDEQTPRWKGKRGEYVMVDGK